MMFRVLLTDDITPEALGVFDNYPDIEAVRVGTLSPDDLKETIAEYDGIVIRTPTKLTADVIQAATRLKYIGRAGVGTDNIDIDAATRQGIVVMNAPTGNTVSTAELTIALLLAVARWGPAVHNSVTRGDWDRKSFTGLELSGKTLGIVGFGRVGREVARRMFAFGMEIVATDPFVTPEDAGDLVKLVGLEELLRRSEAVNVNTHHPKNTTNLIAAAEISVMKDRALLVNCARGGVVSEAALKFALDSGKLAGVALDVYEKEPPGDNPLFGHPRCVFSPHLGAATGEARVRVATEAATAVAQALTTGEIRHPVNRLPE